MRGNQVAAVTFERARAKLRANGRIQRTGGGVAGPVRWSLGLATLNHPTPQIVTLQSDEEWTPVTISGDQSADELVLE